MKIQKYRTGGPEVALAANPALGATILEAAPLAIPAALTAAFIRTYKNPEDTAYARGVRQALESFEARNAAELAQQKVEDKAYNEGLAKYYSKQLANGPMIKPWVNGGTKTITAYDPTTGTYTATFAYPSGSQLYGTFPEINYRATRNLADFSDAYITYPNKGIFRANLTSVDNGTLNYEPWQLIKGLTPQISLPTSAAIARLTAEPQVIALPLEGDFYMSKKKKKNQPAKPADLSSAQPAGDTPTPSQPDKDPDKRKWWDKIKGSWNNSWKGIGNRWQSIGEYSADATAKIIGYGIPVAGAGVGGYYLGKGLGLWGNNQVTEEPVKQEQSEYTYDNANLKEMVKRRNEQRLKADSLNNAQ